jgi:predicted cupin superfamily sugar epimerase
MIPNKITQRLSRTSNKPVGDSYQSTLSDQEIAKKLEDYVRVKKDDVNKIALGTHVRYFTINPQTGEKQFRLGGTLTKFGDNGQYFVCSNGTYSWSVQLNNSIIYKKISPAEIKEHAAEDVKKQMDDIIEENKKLKKLIKQIKETTISSKTKKK